ncbi:MAG: PIN domain-containing protein [Thaumarchaeota archaeon]|nr:PIN domain-containing protein [Nitrososphaerota archaeon]
MPEFRLVLDTTFFILHYFSADGTVHSRTREVLRRCRKIGNRGLLPTIVLSEFYAQAAKRVGSEEAKRRFCEVAESGLDIMVLDTRVSEQAGVLRHKYREKVPWGDCIIAATAIMARVNLILSEDPHFTMIRELKTKKLNDLSL